MKNKVIKLLEEYLDAPEAWGDNVMIEVNPANREVRLNDDEDVDPDASDLDYWPVMDLLQMSVSDPGQWDIDTDAVDELVASY
ncbi:MAG: hypothetical protein Q4C37_07260 [Bacteroidales bacterium]|nr:hypothetical protein [Bacteroidales bacterium]